MQGLWLGVVGDVKGTWGGGGEGDTTDLPCHETCKLGCGWPFLHLECCISRLIKPYILKLLYVIQLLILKIKNILSMFD